MSVIKDLRSAVANVLKELFQIDPLEKDILINTTKPEFEGDYTVVLFGWIKQLRQSPEAIGMAIGKKLKENYPGMVADFNLVKGFLNLSVSETYWTDFLAAHYKDKDFGIAPASGRKTVVEYSSPNTNKPLHLGHLRNNFLGWSVAEILKANGHEVAKTCVVNDRGIHICKSMLAWQKFANGATPESTHTKGDHFVGDYYVKFEEELKKQAKPLLEAILSRHDFSAFNEQEAQKLSLHIDKIGKLNEAWDLEVKKHFPASPGEPGKTAINTILPVLEEELQFDTVNKRSNGKSILKAMELESSKDPGKEKQFREFQKLLKPVISIEEKAGEELAAITEIARNKTAIMKEAREMLLKWEQGDKDTIALWKMMNEWVYEGFAVTYARIGSDFTKTYHESAIYLLGKQYVEEGLQKGVFFQKPDGSVWIDLKEDGLDEKLVQRKDGTSVYITQDIALAKLKYEDFGMDESIYVIGDEQNYHMKVLKLICQKLELPHAEGINHLSYGMVELPSGKMKSREGTVVDADEMVDTMEQIAMEHTSALGKVKDFSEEELKELYTMIGLGALKFFLLRVDPRKRMIFNPEESIDFHGFTGPFVQYTHARIKSILRKEQPGGNPYHGNLLPLEKELLLQLEQFPGIIVQAGEELNPSVIAGEVFHLAKTFNSFYAEHSVTNAESPEKKELRLQLITLTAEVLRTGMRLLGISVPERM